MSRVLIAVVATGLSVVTLAHAKLMSTVPADGDFVPAPKVLALVFADPVRLTGAELKTVDGGDIGLGPLPEKAASSFRIDVPTELVAGEYYLIWRCIAADSHFSTGEFFFTVTD